MQPKVGVGTGLGPEGCSSSSHLLLDLRRRSWRGRKPNSIARACLSHIYEYTIESYHQSQTNKKRNRSEEMCRRRGTPAAVNGTCDRTPSIVFTSTWPRECLFIQSSRSLSLGRSHLSVFAPSGSLNHWQQTRARSQLGWVPLTQPIGLLLSRAGEQHRTQASLHAQRIELYA